MTDWAELGIAIARMQNAGNVFARTIDDLQVVLAKTVGAPEAAETIEELRRRLLDAEQGPKAESASHGGDAARDDSVQAPPERPGLRALKGQGGQWHPVVLDGDL